MTLLFLLCGPLYSELTPSNGPPRLHWVSRELPQTTNRHSYLIIISPSIRYYREIHNLSRNLGKMARLTLRWGARRSINASPRRAATVTFESAGPLIIAKSHRTAHFDLSDLVAALAFGLGRRGSSNRVSDGSVDLLTFARSPTTPTYTLTELAGFNIPRFFIIQINSLFFLKVLPGPREHSPVGEHSKEPCIRQQCFGKIAESRSMTHDS